jgi:hypothetical protein
MFGFCRAERPGRHQVHDRSGVRAGELDAECPDGLQYQPRAGWRVPSFAGGRGIRDSYDDRFADELGYAIADPVARCDIKPDGHAHIRACAVTVAYTHCYCDAHFAPCSYEHVHACSLAIAYGDPGPGFC